MGDVIIAVRDFLEMGGQVLNIIALVIFLMWMLILERISFFQSGLITQKTSIQATGTVDQTRSHGIQKQLENK